MAKMTYGKFSEIIITAYYKAVRSDDANYSIRTIAEMVAHEVAYFAKVNAIEQDRLGESVFANDNFISTYWGLPLLTDTNSNKYIVMPQTPAGLPLGREIAYVGFTGNSKIQVMPMRNKDRFMQSFAKTPKFMVLCYVENGNIVFENISSLVTGPVDLKLVGAIPSGTELVNCVLNIPKDTESLIFDRILGRLNSIRGVLPDMVNDNLSK